MQLELELEMEMGSDHEPRGMLRGGKVRVVNASVQWRPISCLFVSHIYEDTI